MKKLYFFLLACVALTTFNACSLKEDDYFDETPAERSAKDIAEINNLLTKVPNGWLMEYYGNLNFGGYNVMVKFDGDTATFASEKYGPNHPAGIGSDGKVITESSRFRNYKVEQSMGSVLSFDEFNSIFHYFSMPNNPDYTYDTAEGLLGDFEFRVMKATPDSIILRGKKHNNRIVMTPIPADVTWESIIEDAAATEKYMTSRSYTLSGADYNDTIDVEVKNNGNYRCLIFTYRDSTDQKQTIAAPYIVKKDGYYFYRSVTVNGHVLDGLEKGTTDDYFLFHNNHNLQLDAYLPTLAEALTTSNWYMRYGSVGEVAKPYWDAMLANLKTAGKNKTEIKIYTSTIGLTSDNKLACSMTTSTDAPLYGFNTEISKNGTRVKFSQNSTVRNAAGKTYHQKYGWKDVLNCIYTHTFDLSCDYQRRPSWIKMVDVTNPANTITVYSTPSYFMEDSEYYQDKK